MRLRCVGAMVKKTCGKRDVWKRIRLLETCEGSMWPRGVSLKAIRGVEYGAKKERAKQWSR